MKKENLLFALKVIGLILFLIFAFKYGRLLIP